MTDDQIRKAMVLIDNTIAETRQQIAWFAKVVTPSDAATAYINALRERVKVDEAWLAHFKAKLRG
jgi:hypothetical protein